MCQTSKADSYNNRDRRREQDDEILLSSSTEIQYYGTATILARTLSPRVIFPICIFIYWYLRSHLIEAGLLDASQNNLGLVPEAVCSLAQFIVEMGDAWAAKVLQFYSFQVVPDPLGWVQLRRVAQ
jgi:hypothetical protein